MTTQDYANRISQLIQEHEADIGAEWMAQLEALTVRSNVVSKEQLRKHCQQFLTAFSNGTRGGELSNIEHRSWDEVRDLLAEISSTRARNGSTPSETATFVFSLKQTGVPLAEYKKVNPATLGLPPAADGKLEGFLFPSTYEFEPSATATEQLKAMVDLGKKQLNPRGVAFTLCRC